MDKKQEQKTENKEKKVYQTPQITKEEKVEMRTGLLASPSAPW